MPTNNRLVQHTSKSAIRERQKFSNLTIDHITQLIWIGLFPTHLKHRTSQMASWLDWWNCPLQSLCPIPLLSAEIARSVTRTESANGFYRRQPDFSNETKTRRPFISLFSFDLCSRCPLILLHLDACASVRVFRMSPKMTANNWTMRAEHFPW